jgi:hypothetical protein
LTERGLGFGQPFDQGFAGTDGDAFLSAILHLDTALFSEPAEFDGILPSCLVVQLKRQHTFRGQKPERFCLAASSHD